jgi:hypothetical protein
MKLFLAATLLGAVAMIILMPQANALIARMDFNDGHYTFRSLGGPKICGEHLCKPGEWNIWIKQLMSHQLKNVKSAMAVNTQQTSSIKKAAYNEENILPATLDGHIRDIVTFDAGTGKFTSFLPVSYDGILAINHIAISQQTPDVNILKAWIGPNWKTTMTPSSVTFDSSGASLDSGQIANIVVITDGVPTFALDALASR